ncbi:hypothetical protein PC113_g10388 [Phytophthora cactorum]|uniref:Uncharacterized protein n=2 Tax=Phytophthora cactorum TaxID=29920 RepID=A0A8T0Z7B2_9STRA|nr:hypothetical protein PC113_g10388 [Phytophthora cactorum]
MRGELASSRSPYLEMQFWGDDGDKPKCLRQTIVLYRLVRSDHLKYLKLNQNALRVKEAARQGEWQCVQNVQGALLLREPHDPRYIVWLERELHTLVIEGSIELCLTCTLRRTCEDARHATRVRLPFGRRQQRLRRQRQGWAPRRYKVTPRDMSDGTIRMITSTLLERSRDDPFRGPVVTLQPSEEVGVLTRSGTRDGLEGGHGVCKDAVAPSIAVEEERGLTKSVLQQRMSGVQGSSFNTGNVRMVLRCYFGPKFVPDDDSPASRQCGMQLPDCTANKVKYPIEAVSHVRMLFVYRESQKQSGGLPADHAGFLEVLHNQLLQVTAADLVDKVSLYRNHQTQQVQVLSLLRGEMCWSSFQSGRKFGKTSESARSTSARFARSRRKRVYLCDKVRPKNYPKNKFTSFQIWHDLWKNGEERPPPLVGRGCEMRSLGKKRNQLTETDEKEDEKTEEEEDGEEEGEKEEDKVAGGQEHSMAAYFCDQCLPLHNGGNNAEEEDSNKLKKEKLVEEPKQPKITRVNNRLQFKMKDQWAETLFNLKLIVNRLSSRDARTTDKPGAEVLISPTSSSTRESRDEHATSNLLLQRVPSRWMTRFCFSKIWLTSDYTGAHQAEVRHSARAVKHWICAIPFRDELGNVYESYANSFAEYCKKSQLQHQPKSTSHA